MNKNIINPIVNRQYNLTNRAKIHFSILFCIAVGITYSLVTEQNGYIAITLCVLGIVGIQLLPKELNELRTERKDSSEARFPFFILQMFMYSLAMMSVLFLIGQYNG